MRTLSFLTLTLGLALGACADSEPTDELAGESDADGDDGKADANGTYTYYNLSPDFRKCAWPACGGVYVDRVNRAQTACAGGSGGPVWEEVCYATDIDWSNAGLSEDQIGGVMAAMGSGEFGRVLVRGNLRSIERGDGLGKWPRLFVTEAWVAQTEAEPLGVFVKVKDAGIRCITTPCESTAELKLNSALSSTIAGVDFAPSGADESVISKATEAIFDDGMIVAGYRYTIYENGDHARGREAYQVYLRVEAAAPSCFVGGCSGQVCSDQEGVVTTCEWQDEYACYDTATCERQTDGACGWTQTEELTACLAAN
jgi:hypothetical protein